MNRHNRRKVAGAFKKLGVKVFTIKPGEKTPMNTGWQAEAAKSDLKQWENGQDYNIGVMCGGTLLVIDIDMKNGVDGEKNWKALCHTLGIVESDFQVSTPSGGRHIYYWVPDGVQVRNSVSKIAKGVDVRGEGGYVVGPCSEIVEGEYTVINRGARIMEAPAALLEILTKKKATKVARKGLSGEDLDKKDNLKRADDYLEVCEASIEGDGGNHKAFVVAARVRDMGVSEVECLERMLGGWNGRCSPPWDGAELAVVVENAYKYAEGAVGADTPEAQFGDEPDSGGFTKRVGKKLSSIDTMSLTHALVMIGTGHAVAREYLTEEGQVRVTLSKEASFHTYHAANTWFDEEGKRHVVSREWIASPGRPTFEGLTFYPGAVGPYQGKYNQWRGFSFGGIEGLSWSEAKGECDLLLRHLRDIVCRGNVEHYKWLLNYLAHSIQYPEKKPETAIVIMGRKGAGKSLIFDVMGTLAREHYFMTADKRMMMGNFNAHMETALWVQFEEAVWAGDKAAESKLKILITGKWHVIERKGYEAYMVGNYSRVGITSNSDWAVPASVDERRFAIFNALAKMKDNKPYFKAIFDQLKGDDNKGYRAFMTLLSGMPVDKLAVHVPPKTEALAEQKMETLECYSKWLYDALEEGEIPGIGTGFEEEDGWVLEVEKSEIYEAYCAYVKASGFRYPKSMRSFGRHLFTMLGGQVTAGRKRSGSKMPHTYKFGTLENCRNAFEKWFNSDINW